jgi:hypothetical protein
MLFCGKVFPLALPICFGIRISGFEFVVAAPLQDFRDRPKRRCAPHSKTLREVVERWDSVTQLFAQNVERLDRNPGIGNGQGIPYTAPFTKHEN